METDTKIQTSANSTSSMDNKNEENCQRSMDNDEQKPSNDNEKASICDIEDNQITEQMELDILGEVDCCKLRADIRTLKSTITELRDEISDLYKKIYEINKCDDTETEKDKSKTRNPKKCTISTNSPQEKYIVIKQKQTDLKPSRCADLICDVETTLTNTIHCMNERFFRFEAYVNCSLQNINGIISQNKSEEELLKYVQNVRLEFEDLKQDILELQYKKDAQCKQNEIFQEQIDALRIVKCDKEEVEEALADKADLCALNKKVSHEQFDAVCDGLARSLEETIAKLSQQETIWQQSLDELRREMEGKLDELEIPALKDFINNELRALKNQLRVLSEIKREQEAAGARKVLRNMRCISCDKDVFMRTDPKLIPGSKIFPCRPTTKPYLTFKMNQVREKKKCLSQGKNLVPLEKVENETSARKTSQIENACESMTRDKFCNRYCGGSHTTMSPQQKLAITRSLTQWGMQDLHMVEGFIEGTDGQMYKGRWFIKQKMEK